MLNLTFTEDNLDKADWEVALLIISIITCLIFCKTKCYVLACGPFHCLQGYVEEHIQQPSHFRKQNNEFKSHHLGLSPSVYILIVPVNFVCQIEYDDRAKASPLKEQPKQITNNKPEFDHDDGEDDLDIDAI